VTITSSNDNDHTGDQTLTVTGTVEGADDMTVKSVELTVTDDDVPNGRVRLVLKRSRIDESDDDDADNGNQAQDTLTATLRGGTTFDEDISIAVAVSPAGVVTPADTEGGEDGHQIGTLTINIGEKESDGAGITITATNNTADDGNRVVTVSASIDDADVDDERQPDPVALVIVDDDAAPGAPTGLTATEATANTGVITVSWKAPSNMGKVDGEDPSSVTYVMRHERTSVIGDNDQAFSVVDGQADDDDATLFTFEINNRVASQQEYTVQIRARTDAGDSGIVSAVVTVASGS
jgi:hypothetical protein